MNGSAHSGQAGPGTPDILVCYGGRPVALVGAGRFSFVGDVRRRPPGDPAVRIVTHMGYYAQLVLAGEMPEPYTDADAQRFARYALIDSDALARRSAETDEVVAAEFGVPTEEIGLARQELAGE